MEKQRGVNEGGKKLVLGDGLKMQSVDDVLLVSTLETMWFCEPLNPIKTKIK